METTTLRLDQIRRDGGTQPRACTDYETVAEYAEAMERGDKFPPCGVLFDGTTHWLWDGFHRCEAAEDAELEEIECIVEPGTQQDAQWRSYGANGKHGLRRSNADKRRAVEAALRMRRELADRVIAEHCGVDHKTVGTVRAQIFPTGEIPQTETRVGRDGRETNVSGINAGRGGSSTGSNDPVNPEYGEHPAPEGGWPQADEDGVYDDDQAEVLPEVVGKRWCDIKVMQIEPPSLLWKQEAWISAWSIGCQPCVESQQLRKYTQVFPTRNQAVCDAAFGLAVYCGTHEQSENVPKTTKEILARFRQWAIVTGSVNVDNVQREIKRQADQAVYRLDADVEDYVNAIVSLLNDRTEFTLAKMAARFVELSSDTNGEGEQQPQDLDAAIVRLQEFVAAVRVVEAEREVAGVAE